MNETPFTRWLKTAMDRRGMIQSQVAYRLGVSPAAVSRWVNGSSRPDTEYVRRLAGLFDEPLQKIYSLAGHPAEYDPPAERQISPREAILEALADMPPEVPIYDAFAGAGAGQVDVR